MNITLVTGNDGKWNLAVAQLAPLGFELTRATFDLPEVQSFDSAEIAAESVKLACAKVGGPVMVTDVSYSLAALKGFPGPFSRYTNHYLTPQDFVAMMAGKTDRRFAITEALAYLEPEMAEPKVFTSVMQGTIAEEAHGARLMDSLTILDGMDKPLAAYPVEEVRAYWESHLTHFVQLAEWLAKR